jgi:hypothetical protein
VRGLELKTEKAGCAVQQDSKEGTQDRREQNASTRRLVLSILQ